MDQNTSFLDRLLSKPRPLGFKLGISLLFLLLPFGAAALDGVLNDILREGLWRVLILPPVIIIYCWFLSPVLSRMGVELIRTARSLVIMDEASFTQLITMASRTNPLHEWMAFAAGVILAILISLPTSFGQNTIWLRLYWSVGLALMYGLLGWILYGSFVSTRLNAAIHRQQLNIDIFDLTPFEMFGRHSLILALAFVGGMTLSLLCTFRVQSLYRVEFWVMYILLALVTVLIFFLSMRPTHQVLSKEKDRELKAIRDYILRASRDLMRCIDQNQDTSVTASEINALVVYEGRLQATQTWPYNTRMLRTLFVSVLIPLGTMLVREAVDFLTGG